MKVTDESRNDDSATPRNKSYSHKRDILRKFMPLTLALLMFVCLCTIAFLFVSRRYVLNETHGMLEEQYSRYGRHISRGESFQLGLKVTWTGLELAATMLADFYRTNYSTSNSNETYLGYEESLAGPIISGSDRFPELNVSLAHSSYTFPMSHDELLHNQSKTQVFNREFFAKIDSIFSSTIAFKRQLFRQYFGLEEDGLLLMYPGQSMQVNESNMDPRNQTWYQVAKESPNKTNIIEPYLDPLSDCIIVTISRAVFHVESGDFKGVAAIDVRIKSFEQSVHPEYGLDREIVLHRVTGQAYLDSEWFVSESNSNFSTSVENMSNPSLTIEDWNRIKRSVEPDDTNEVYISEPYYCYVHRFNYPMENFLFVSFAKRENVEEEATELKMAMLRDWHISLALIGVVSCILIAITLTVFYWTVVALARDVDRSYKEINKLFHSLRDEADLRANSFDEKGSKRISRNMEAFEKMESNTSGMLSPVKKSSSRRIEPNRKSRPLSKLLSPNDSVNTNPFWNKKHPFLHHYEDSECFLTRPKNTPSPHQETVFARHKPMDMKRESDSDSDGSSSDCSYDDAYSVSTSSIENDEFMNIATLRQISSNTFGSFNSLSNNSI